MSKKFYVRCRNCWGRRTFKCHPDEYLRPPACRHCGMTEKHILKVKHKGKVPNRLVGKSLLYQFDKYRTENPIKDRSSQGLCDTGLCGYHYPHRLGSLLCQYREDHIINQSLKDIPSTHTLGGDEPGF